MRIHADTHHSYMQKVLELARKGEGYTAPNPLVGAIIVREGEIVGQGFHQYYGGPHAEILALEEAGERARGATLYVNLEPCCHYGKTPPCTKKIIDSGVKRVLAAMFDPNPLVAGKGVKELQENGIEVEVGLLRKEAERLNEVYIRYISSDRPFVYLKSALTLDGFIATVTGDSRWISNEKARLFAHTLRHKVDAVLVWIGTILKDDSALTTRLPDGRGEDSIRIILDPELSIPPDARVINQKSRKRTILVCGEDYDNKKYQGLLRKENLEILSVQLNEEGKIPLKALLRILHKQGISSILVEGGGRVNYSFLKEGLVDKVYFFIAPIILGGDDGIRVFSGEGVADIEKSWKLRDVQYNFFDDNILISAYL